MIAMTKEGEHSEDIYWGIVDSIIKQKKASVHPHLRPVNPKHSFKLKKNDNEILAECYLLEELRDALKEAPKEAVLHHLDGRNDFATWVRNIIGDKELAGDLELIRPSREIDVQAKLIHVLDSRIKNLKADSVNLIFD